MLIRTRRADPETEARIRRLQYTPEQVARLVEGVEPFDPEAWLRETPPPTPEELAEMEEFLRERNAEREASRAREAGLGR